MTTDGPRPMRTLGEPGPGKGPVLFRAMTACDCGCGLPARFEFRVGRDAVMIDDPAMVRALIAEMRAGLELLWGPGPTEACRRLLEALPTLTDAEVARLRDGCEVELARRDVCEHGVRFGEYCRDCREEYRRAAIEHCGEEDRC